MSIPAVSRCASMPRSRRASATRRARFSSIRSTYLLPRRQTTRTRHQNSTMISAAGATATGPATANRWQVSELGQLGAGRRDAHLMRAEVDDQSGVILDAHDPAEAVLIVSHLVLHGELLGGRGGGRGLEGACGQEAPGRGGGRLHHIQYAP